MAATATLGARTRLAATIALLLSPVTLIGALWTVRQFPSAPGEYSLFGPSGRDILTGHFADAFADKLVQAGPFELIPYGVAQLIDITSTTGWVVFYTVIGVVLVALFAFTLVSSIPVGTDRRLDRIVLAAGALAILSTAIPHAVQSGHLSHITVPTLWVLAALRARRGGLVTAGLLVAASAGFEAWGVLGVPVLLLGAFPRLWIAALAFLGGVAVLYLPFVLAGPFPMFTMTWGVLPHSVLKIVVPQLSAMTWPLRLLQGVLSLGAGAAVALLLRRRAEVVWLVPLAVIALRLATDPLIFGYYFMSPTLVLLGLAALYAATGRWVAAAVAVVIALVFGIVLGLAPPLAGYTTVGLFALPVLAVAAVLFGRFMNPEIRRSSLSRSRGVSTSSTTE